MQKFYSDIALFGAEVMFRQMDSFYFHFPLSSDLENK